MAPRRAPGADALRWERFVDLQQALLAAAPDPTAVAGCLTEAVARILGVRGVAIGLLEDNDYHLLAAHGVDVAYRARYHGAAAHDGVARALSEDDPVIFIEPAAPDGRALRTILLPFPRDQITGALHLVVSADTVLTAEDMALARPLTLLAASALLAARHCDRLTRTVRVKNDGLAAMAHDLRTPLNALVGYTNLLHEGAFGALTADQREITGILERQAYELVDLLDATLDIARLETTTQVPVRTEEFTLADVLTSLRAATFAHASRGGRLFTAVSKDLPPMCSDRVKVKEILQNLVDNALKHSGDGPVTVDASLAADQESVRVTVRDSGPGIAADVLPHLFEPFRPGRGRRFGSGYGLYLVRCFSEALGGRVAARSTPGEGTAVTVELPLSAPRR